MLCFEVFPSHGQILKERKIKVFFNIVSSKPGHENQEPLSLVAL